MARRRRGERVLGPYKHQRGAKQWRVVTVSETGRRTPDYFESKKEAEAYAKILRGKLRVEACPAAHRSQSESRNGPGVTQNGVCSDLPRWRSNDANAALQRHRRPCARVQPVMRPDVVATRLCLLRQGSRGSGAALWRAIPRTSTRGCGHPGRHAHGCSHRGSGTPP